MEKKIAIRGHKTRGKDVIRALEGMGGTNEIGFDGSDSNCAYYIRHDFMISIEKLDKPPLGESYSLYTIEEYEEYMKNKKEAEHSGAEKLVEEALKQYEVPTGSVKIWDLPEGYIFKDENGNVINATKIVLEKKKKEYPKTYEECLSVLEIYNRFPDVEVYNAKPSECALFESFIRLKRCRDAYWKLYGEEMGLGKPWEPDWNIRGYYAIARSYGNVIKTSNYNCDLTFVFPTEEMRDAFKENFDTDVEFCKEFL